MRLRICSEPAIKNGVAGTDRRRRQPVRVVTRSNCVPGSQILRSACTQSTRSGAAPCFVARSEARERASAEMSAAVTCQASVASQVASAPSPQPASNAVPGARLPISRARYGFRKDLLARCVVVRLLPVGVPVVLVECLLHHPSAGVVATSSTISVLTRACVKRMLSSASGKNHTACSKAAPPVRRGSGSDQTTRDANRKR